MAKLLALLAAREGVAESLAKALREEADHLRDALGSNSAVTGLVRLADDPFAQQYPALRGFDAALDARADDEAALVDAAAGQAERLGAVVHADLCAALVGELRDISGADRGPVRFVYCMRHRADQDHAHFAAHWGGPHAEFGRRTPGILGYDQFHPDPEHSREAARAAGYGVWRIDGVPELHLRSLEEFFGAAVGSDVGDAAIEDEKSFVDGANSVGFTLRELFRLA